LHAIRPTPVPLRLWRVFRLALHLGYGVCVAAWTLHRLPPALQEKRILRWSAQFLQILGVRVHVLGSPPPPTARHCLFVANHISWIDIWALKQLHPMHFVAKSEIRDWPVIGWLAQRAGTLFIERARRQDTGRMVKLGEEALRRGDCLCFFPEGTTTDGSHLLPFKPGLLQAAINAGATVVPVAIRYPSASGGINRAVAYHGETTMLESFRAVLRQRETRVELCFGAPVAAAGLERRTLAHQARHAIVSLLDPAAHKTPGTTAGLPDASH